MRLRALLSGVGNGLRAHGRASRPDATADTRGHLATSSRGFVAIAALCLAPLVFIANAGAQTGTVTYSLSPTSGAAGDQVTVTGSGCGAGAGRFVFVTSPQGNFSGQHQTEFTANSSGAFSFTLTVPNVPAGTYSTGIVCTGGEAGWPADNPSAVTFTVVGQVTTTTTASTTSQATTTTVVAQPGTTTTTVVSQRGTTTTTVPLTPTATPVAGRASFTG